MKVYALVRRTGGWFQLELGLSPCQPPQPPPHEERELGMVFTLTHTQTLTHTLTGTAPPSLVNKKAVRGRERGRKKNFSVFV